MATLITDGTDNDTDGKTDGSVVIDEKKDENVEGDLGHVDSTVSGTNIHVIIKSFEVVTNAYKMTPDADPIKRVVPNVWNTILKVGGVGLGVRAVTRKKDKDDDRFVQGGYHENNV